MVHRHVQRFVAVGPFRTAELVCSMLVMRLSTFLASPLMALALHFLVLMNKMLVVGLRWEETL